MNSFDTSRARRLAVKTFPVKLPLSWGRAFFLHSMQDQSVPVHSSPGPSPPIVTRTCAKKRNQVLIAVLVPSGIALVLGIVFMAVGGGVKQGTGAMSNAFLAVGAILFVGAIITTTVALPILLPRACDDTVAGSQ